MHSPKLYRPLIPLLLGTVITTACSRAEPPSTAQATEPVAVVQASPEAPPAAEPEPPALPEVIVLSGPEAVEAWLQSENWWGDVNREEPLKAPHVILAGINPAWSAAAQELTVPQKKQLFYRLMLPLVMHANARVLEFRDGLQQAQNELDSDGAVSPESLALLQRLAILLPDEAAQYSDALANNGPELAGMISKLLYQVDVVPAGLALGQAAYESGYGTSRFAVQGNSLFGQWTYKGDGIVPGKQRKSLGNHQIKAFDWPFDSVRGYYINLMSHPAYEDFRRLRAERRAAGEPLDSLALADGLVKYSERGQEYVDSLKGMIRSNDLDIADEVVFRDEALRFIISEPDPEAAARLELDIERMRANGELGEIVERMQLD
ncbi:MAG: glucosaminidase domain-containing protein [Halieaceae bacterium]|nr:glucosaminidase domain-containing protein [Halieaceae bacterium]MCP5203437.1 glucosaminidase domain-containing protein [Pseudomonadales bacterium]